MNDGKNYSESFNKVKIIKPKVVRLCPSRKIKKSSSSSSSSSSSNSEKNPNQIYTDEQKNSPKNLDDISIEEINKDFFKFGESLEEELCLNELMDILNNDKDIVSENIPKIKRCKKPYDYY